MHFLISSSKLHIHTFQFYMTCDDYLLSIKALEPHYFSWRARVFLTVLKLNPLDCCFGHQMTNPQSSYFNQNFTSVAIIAKYFEY